MTLTTELEGSPDIMIVDDDSSVILSLRQVLKDLGRIRFASTGGDALALVGESQPTLILLDVELPDMSGLEVCKQLKSDPETLNIPILFITSHTEPGFEEKVFEAGAADYISKPLNPSVVAARAKTQLAYRAVIGLLENQARIDSLTGLPNRRKFDEVLLAEFKRAHRQPMPFTVMMVDIDDFKKYNDHYGHLAGDQCLATIAQTLSAATRRPADFVARYGGEEFALILPGTERQGAAALAGWLIESVEKRKIVHGAGSTRDHVTISIGLISLTKEQIRAFDRTAMELVDAADHALYHSKQIGRNCFSSHTLSGDKFSLPAAP